MKLNNEQALEMGQLYVTLSFGDLKMGLFTDLAIMAAKSIGKKVAKDVLFTATLSSLQTASGAKRMELSEAVRRAKSELSNR